MANTKSNTGKLDISVILTGFNEGSVLSDNLKRIEKVLNDTKYSWEIILYDDKSQDETLKIFRSFAKKKKT